MLFMYLMVFSYIIGWLIYKNYSFLKPSKVEKKYKVSIIIPARNEEHNIVKLLNSLNKQKYQIYEIIVVDDNSKDRTSEIVKSFDNVKLIKLTDEPPEGWRGKTWACWNGSLNASGDILVFIDADVKLSENSIESLVFEYEKNKGMISVWPYQKFKKGYEHFNYILNIAAVSSVTVFKFFVKTDPIGAFGPVLLTSRDDYFKTGGHAAVRNEIVEDLAIGQLYRKNGINVKNFLGNNLVKFRMYPNGFKEMFQGLTKNMLLGMEKSNLSNTILLTIWILGLFASIPINIDIYRLAFYLAFVHQLYIITIKTGDYNLIDAFIYPVYLLFFIFLFFISIYKTIFKKKVLWKDREIILNNTHQVDD